MFKKITYSSTLFLSLTLLAVPAGSIYAQPVTPRPSTVTGGDPEPTGQAVVLLTLLPTLVAL